MSYIKYKLLTGNRETADSERAVLPTILFAKKSEGMGAGKVICWAIVVGWWAWGIGFMRTSFKD